MIRQFRPNPLSNECKFAALRWPNSWNGEANFLQLRER
jgi:hypothetical protein